MTMTSIIKLTQGLSVAHYTVSQLPTALNNKDTKAKCLPQQVSKYFFIFLLCLLFLARWWG